MNFYLTPGHGGLDQVSQLPPPPPPLTQRVGLNDFFAPICIKFTSLQTDIAVLYPCEKYSWKLANLFIRPTADSRKAQHEWLQKARGRVVLVSLKKSQIKALTHRQQPLPTHPNAWTYVPYISQPVRQWWLEKVKRNVELSFFFFYNRLTGKRWKFVCWWHEVCWFYFMFCLGLVLQVFIIGAAAVSAAGIRRNCVYYRYTSALVVYWFSLLRLTLEGGHFHIGISFRTVGRSTVVALEGRVFGEIWS